MPLIEVLYEAVRSPVGILVECEEGADRLRQKLYALRRSIGDAELDGLSFLLSPINPATELWIVKVNRDASNG